MEFSHRSGRDLINVAKKRTNVIPVIEDARHPHKYRMLIGEGEVLGSKRPIWGLGALGCIVEEVMEIIGDLWVL